MDLCNKLLHKFIMNIDSTPGGRGRQKHLVQFYIMQRSSSYLDHLFTSELKNATDSLWVYPSALARKKRVIRALPMGIILSVSHRNALPGQEPPP